MAVTPPSIRKSAPTTYGRIVRREVNCQLRDFQRIGHPLAWIVGSEDVLNRRALLFAWEATETSPCPSDLGLGYSRESRGPRVGAEDSSEMDDRGLCGRFGHLGRRLRKLPVTASCLLFEQGIECSTR